MRRSINLLIIFSAVLALVLWMQAGSQQTVSANSATTEIAFIGDFGGDTPAQADVANLIDSWKPNFIVTVGDNRYGIADLDLAVGKYYCDYLHRAQPGPHCPSGGTTNRNRFFPTVGNHDYSDGNGIQDYLDYFRIPGHLAGSSNTSGTELYYDFTLGSVHFISLNSETGESENSAQALWAKDQLENSTAPFQVVLMHRSTYTSVERGSRAGHMRWPFEEWGADAIINGDDHLYERLMIGNIPYIVNGAGGRSLHRFGTIDAASKARFSANYGALRLLATNDKLEFEYYSRDGVVRDSFELPYEFEACRTISLPAIEDTWINSIEPDRNYSDEKMLLFDGAPDHGTLIRWDLSSIPAGTRLKSAPIITLDYVDRTVNQYDIFAMRRSWKVGNVTWHKYKDNKAWPGGAGALGDSGSLLGSTAGNNQPKENIVLNTAGQELIEGWIDGRIKSNGILIANYESASNGGDIYHRPLLTLEYCLSEPTNVQMYSAETNPSPSSTLLITLLFVLTASMTSVQLRKHSSSH